MGRKASAITTMVLLLLGALALGQTEKKGSQGKAAGADSESSVPIVEPGVVVEPSKGKPSHYDELPGLDMTLMTVAERKKLIERLNREKCTCGCEDDSLAYCLNNDAGCEFALPLARLAASEISGNYKKAQSETDLMNWPKYRHPTESMKMQYNYLKGFDLDELAAPQRKLLLAKANAIMCDCGCQGDTLARCVNADPGCTTAPAKIRELIDQIKHTVIAP